MFVSFFYLVHCIRQSSARRGYRRPCCSDRTCVPGRVAGSRGFELKSVFDREWRRFYNLDAIIVLTTCVITRMGLTFTTRSPAARDASLARWPGVVGAV
ncbi:MAG: hypothetical protein CMJ62_00930 [Planctomycetaceae bacterium]|nr:hypothetical protein [Planctomycetaceae bacterium]